MKRKCICLFWVIVPLCFSSCAWYIGRGVPLFSPKPFVDETPYDSKITLPYDSATFAFDMTDVLSGALSFVRSSIKPVKSGRSAAVSPAENDLYEGWIDSDWNLPSNVYGTDTEPYRNVLTVNGEYLGRMQSLMHHMNAEGQYDKAVFQYKGHLYYVLPDENGLNRPPVLCSADDYNHVFLNMADKTWSSDYSEFSLWTWNTLKDGSWYREGNCGRGCTLRRVQMLDGSYATVTVCWDNAEEWGYRVWISEGKYSRNEYPTNTSGGMTFPDNVPEGLESNLGNWNGRYDYVYEVVNDSGYYLRVQPYLFNLSVSDNMLQRTVVSTGYWYTLYNGQSQEFRFSLDDLCDTYKYSDLQMGVRVDCYGYTDDGWWHVVDEGSRNVRHSVTFTDAGNLSVDGESKDLGIIPEGDFISFYLADYGIPDGVGWVEFKRREGSSTDNWESVMEYLDNGDDGIDTDVVLYDYYVDAGKTYEYQLVWQDPYTGDEDTFGPFPMYARDGFGEFVFSKGSGTLDEAAGTLNFTELPSFTCEHWVGTDRYLNFIYETQYSGNAGLDFNIYGLQNNSGSIKQAYENHSNMWGLKGKTLYPLGMLARIEIDADENCKLMYSREYLIDSGDTSYPAIKVSDDGLSYTAVLNQW